MRKQFASQEINDAQKMAEIKKPIQQRLYPEAIFAAISCGSFCMFILRREDTEQQQQHAVLLIRKMDEKRPEEKEEEKKRNVIFPQEPIIYVGLFYSIPHRLLQELFVSEVQLVYDMRV